MADSPMQVDKSPCAYVWNNPVKLTDPSGMHPEMEEEDERRQGAGNYFEFGAGASIGIDGVGGVYKKEKESASSKNNCDDFCKAAEKFEKHFRESTGKSPWAEDQYWDGLADGFSNFYSNLGEAISNPWKTFKNNLANFSGIVGLYNSAKFTFYDYPKSFVDTYNDFEEGNYYQAGLRGGHSLGQGSFEVGMTLISAGYLRGGNINIGKFQGAIDYHNWILRKKNYPPIYQKFWHYHWGTGKASKHHVQFGTKKNILYSSDLRKSIFGWY